MIAKLATVMTVALSLSFAPEQPGSPDSLATKPHCCAKHAYCCVLKRECCPDALTGSVALAAPPVGNPTGLAPCCVKRAYCCTL